MVELSSEAKTAIELARVAFEKKFTSSLGKVVIIRTGVMDVKGSSPTTDVVVVRGD